MGDGKDTLGRILVGGNLFYLEERVSRAYITTHLGNNRSYVRRIRQQLFLFRGEHNEGVNLKHILETPCHILKLFGHILRGSGGNCVVLSRRGQ